MILDKAPWFTSASKSSRWLVGVSGGADSVALLHLLLATGFENLVVCHLNHGLRGPDSDEDEAFVRRLAADLNLPCETALADVKERMRQSGESMETAARHARHEFYATCAVKFGCPRLLLAHHANDQAETVLWNLLRGSYGLKGMSGGRKLTTESGVELEVVRPLLGVRRAELVAWLEERGLGWREDASNAEPVAIRNRLRHEVFPLLGEITGRDVVAAFARGAGDTDGFEEMAEWVVSKAEALDPQGRLHLPVLRKLPEPVQRLVLRKFLQAGGVAVPDRELLERALALLDVGNAAVVNLPGGARLRRSAARLWIDGQGFIDSGF